jgi:chemotaxis protein MotA
MKFSMDMVFAGEKSELIYKETKNLINQQAMRRSYPVDILNTMAAYAPAFGMAGTLIGLVILLSNLADKDSIGVGMAIAIITTLYGVIFSNLILKPTAAKLDSYNGIQRFRETLILEGVAMLPNKPDPYYIQNHLNSFLDPKFHFDSADG